MPQLQETYLTSVEERLAQLENLVNNLFTIPDPWVELYKGVQKPTYKHKGDAGQDIRAFLDVDPFNPWYREAFGDGWVDLIADAQLFKQKRDEQLISFVLLPGEVFPVPTGLALNLPEGFECQIRPRSGLAAKSQITVLNSPGTIDCGYKTSSESLNEVCILLQNHSEYPYQVTHGDRIAQAVFSKVVTVSQGCEDGFCPISDFKVNKRFSGFGSSGVK